MDSATAFAQLQMRLVDQTQGRDEVIRPLGQDAAPDAGYCVACCVRCHSR
jgi:hypothetical protein